MRSTTMTATARLWLWRWLNRLRVWMLHRRMKASAINQISALCARLRRDEACSYPNYRR